MNLLTLRTEVRGELQEATAAEFTDAELTAYCNDGVLICSQLTEWFEDTYNQTVTAGTASYTLPTNILHLARVTYDRVFLPQTTHYELDRDLANWRAASNGKPVRHYEPQWDTLKTYPPPDTTGTSASFTAELGAVIAIEDPSGTPDTGYTFDSELGVVIAVEDTAGGQVKFEPDLGTDPFTTTSGELGEMIAYSTDEGNLAYYYTRLPDTLVADTDSPQLPSFVHPAIVPYAVFRALEREGPFQDLELAKAYFMDFGDWMEACLRIQGRNWPDKVLTLTAVEVGSLFENRLSSIGAPQAQDLKPSY